MTSAASASTILSSLEVEVRKGETVGKKTPESIPLFKMKAQHRHVPWQMFFSTSAVNIPNVLFAFWQLVSIQLTSPHKYTTPRSHARVFNKQLNLSEKLECFSCGHHFAFIRTEFHLSFYNMVAQQPNVILQSFAFSFASSSLPPWITPSTQQRCHFTMHALSQINQKHGNRRKAHFY